MLSFEKVLKKEFLKNKCNFDDHAYIVKNMFQFLSLYCFFRYILRNFFLGTLATL
jgi:hypothetical protein